MVNMYGKREDSLEKLICALSIRGVSENKDLINKLIAYTEFDISLKYSVERYYNRLVYLDAQVLRDLKAAGSILDFKFNIEFPFDVAYIRIELMNMVNPNIELVIRRRDWSIAEWNMAWERIK